MFIHVRVDATSFAMNLFFLELSSGSNSEVDQDTLDSVTSQGTIQTPVSAAPTTTMPTSIPPVTSIPSPVTFTHDKVEPVKGIQAVMVKTMTASGEISSQMMLHVN